MKDGNPNDKHSNYRKFPIKSEKYITSNKAPFTMVGTKKIDNRTSNNLTLESGSGISGLLAKSLGAASRESFHGASFRNSMSSHNSVNN